ncbi:cell division protein FtsA [Clostridium magnum]|uniref:Cell division protein FtsA n=1 Tax=Clostridium magnum DSM 2767 TaxID=1121326 RepID=A0A162UXZ4_9CLOT|nr:cell division protein FtsA [Clostridium magnum]KZL94401.1 cell division protein FtsA [Clostridium magnum DSM 2767]SHI22511.1 cell division protein FtsA [Clostridium magnum DSM 2767]
MSEYIIGIDVGSSKICAAAGKLDKYGRLQIMGITSANCNGVKKSIVVDIDSTSESIKQCIDGLERMIDIKITEAYISLPGGISELVWNKGVVAVASEDREIKANDVKRVIKASKIITIPSDKEIIGVIPQQYVIDGYDKIKDPIGMSGLRLEVDAQIILSQSTVVNNLFKSVDKAGIKVAGVVFQPIAISEVALKREEIERGVVLLDVGAESINIYMFEGGNLAGISTIALGGNTITNDIAVCLKLPFSEAEKLKIKYGSVGVDSNNNDFKIEVNADYNEKISVGCNTLKQVIEARVEELLYIISGELKASEHYEKISGVVIVGGGLALIKGIEDFSREVLQKPVRVGTPEYIGAASPLYSAAVGAVKDASDSMKDRNFIAKKEKETEKVQREWTREKNKKEKEEEKNNGGFITKIKEFFTDFF